MSEISAAPAVRLRPPGTSWLLYAMLSLAGGLGVGIVAAIVAAVGNAADWWSANAPFFVLFGLLVGMVGAIIGTVGGVILRLVGGPDRALRLRPALLWALIPPSVFCLLELVAQFLVSHG